MTEETQVKTQLTDEGLIDIPGLASRWVRLADGRRAHYMTCGDKGPAVVLLHGGIEGSSGTAGWRFMAPFLAAQGFRVYCPDRPGFGLSDVSRVEYLDASPKAQVDFLRMFADALCLDKFHLSGNSMGCVVSAWFAVSHPERLLSVAFIAGFIGDIAGSERIPGKASKFSVDPAFQYAPYDGTPQRMQELMHSIIYAKAAISPEVIEMRVRAADMQRAARVKAGLPPRPNALPTDDANMLASVSTKGRLDRLTVPMIYLYGLLDVMTPVENGFIQEDVAPNIQFFYPDHTGHQGQTDRPDLFNQTFLEFFRDGKVSWRTAQAAGVSLRRPIDPRYVEQPAGGFPAPRPGIYADLEILRSGLKQANLKAEFEPAE